MGESGHRHGHSRNILLCLFGALLLILLLSALVEAPVSDGTGDTATLEPVIFYHIALPPSAIPARDGFETFVLSASSALLVSYTITLPGLLALVASAAFSACRDANGRWIRKKRYVNSVYQVFRQEIACG